MNLKLSVDSYKGVDGSSLSPTRCSQIVLVYTMLEKMGNEEITYIGIQKEAEKNKIFGKTTKAKSAIRTFFPLLKKIGFVKYDDSFPANKCFTKNGQEFALACRLLENLNDKLPNYDEIITRLQSIKCNAQTQGLLNMYNNPEYQNHNMWIALKLFKEFKSIHWNEFLYCLYTIQEGRSINNAITDIQNNKLEIDNITFTNEDGNPLPNTCYSYIRAYLEEIKFINNISSKESIALEGAAHFFTLIDL